METFKIITALHQSASFNTDLYSSIFIHDEITELEYKSIRDTVVFTNKRLLVIDVQGISGRKKEFLSIPYSKITAFSGETAGTFDFDGELKVWVSGMPPLQLQFLKGTNVKSPIQFISNYVL